MPKKTITKNLLIVIFCVAVSLIVCSCGHGPVNGGQPPSFDQARSEYAAPRSVGHIESREISESSGIAYSKCQPNVLWTHNDSGDGPFVFAIDPTGKALGTWKIENASNVDWEDIAAFKDSSGKCFLYIGETGNERKSPRAEHRVYRIPEPGVSSADKVSNRNEAILVAGAEILIFIYPDERQDSETLMVHTDTGDIYVVTKRRDTAAGVYKIRPDFGKSPVTAERIAEITVPSIPNGLLTGGDISPDGKRVVVCDYFAAFELTLPADAKGFDNIWKQKPVPIDLGDRKQGEAIGYSADGFSLFATSEGVFQPLIQVNRRH